MRPVRLMTYNVCRDGMGYGVKGWSARRRGIIATILRSRPDIAGLQEVTERQLLDLDEALMPYGYSRAGARLDGDLCEHRNAIYFGRERFAYAGREYFELVGVTSRAADGRRVGRSLNWATFTEHETACSLTVANLHLDPRDAEFRDLAVVEILSNPDLRGTILMGDFNAVPGSRIYNDLCARQWRDSCVVSDERRGGDVTMHRYGHSAKRVDWVLVPPRWHVLAHEILLPRDGPAPSDHYPVVVSLAARAPTASLNQSIPPAAARPPPMMAARELYEALRAWRLAEARRLGVPAYVVAHDATLEDLCISRPSTRAELAQIWGIGPYKMRRWGDTILQVVAGEPAEAQQQRTAVTSSSTAG